MQLFDKINDNLIEFDKILVNLRNIQETQIINSTKFKFSFAEQSYEKRFKKQKEYQKKQYIKTKNFSHGLKKAWEAFEKPDDLEQDEYLLNVKGATDQEDEENINNLDKIIEKKSKKIAHGSPKKYGSPARDKVFDERDEIARQKMYEPVVDDIFRDMKRKAMIPKFFENRDMELVEKLELISKFLK